VFAKNIYDTTKVVKDRKIKNNDENALKQS
jgi:hypothetical protein